MRQFITVQQKKKSSYNAKMQVWISAYSLNHLCSNGFNNDSRLLEALKWHPYNINLLMYIAGPIEYDLTTEIYKFCLYYWAFLSWGLPSRGESCSHQTLQIFITTHSSGTLWRPQTSADKTSPILVNNHMFVVTSAGSELIFLASLSSFLWLSAVTVSLRPIIFPAVI